jgi:hypothetical protein
MKDQIMNIIDNIYFQQILHNFYNIQINIITFYQEYLLNFVIYECQDKNINIETKSFIIEKANNNYYKNIINNYIINNYIIFNNNNYYIKFFTKELFINLEIFIISLQKILYEYINFITPFYNFYSNYKILIDKKLHQTNFESLYYNASLNLLLEETNFNAHQRDFLKYLEQKSNKTNPELLKFLLNYHNSFNKMTFYVYKSISETYVPFKPRSKYGIDIKYRAAKQ